MFGFSQLLHYPSQYCVLQKKKILQNCETVGGGGSTCGQRSVWFPPTRLWNRPLRPSLVTLNVTCCTVVIVVALFDMSKQCQNPIQNVLVSRPYLSFVCVWVCMGVSAYVLAYITVKAFSLLFWQRNRNIWLASLAPHWFSQCVIWHILFSVV